MANFPSLPTTVDRYVRQLFDMLLGRTGDIRNRIVTMGDLENLGQITIKPQALTAPAGVQTPVVDFVEGSTSKFPTTPAGLTTTNTFGAVALDWAPANYQGHAYTEVWRAAVDDREQAQKVHESISSEWLNITGSGDSFWYWIRHVNSNGSVSGFNALSGTQGQGEAAFNVTEFILQHPEISEQPFVVVNQGTDDEPDYKMAIAAEVILLGGASVSVSDLESGELRAGVQFSIGNGSIQFSTASDGTGQIVVAGSGGIPGNDYLLINNGKVLSYVYDQGQHHPYKELMRWEHGTAASGAQVVIPAYFKAKPDVILTPAFITSYEHRYADQPQRIKLLHTDPTPHPVAPGVWLFTPRALLVVDELIEEKYQDNTHDFLTSGYEAEFDVPPNTDRIEFDLAVVFKKYHHIARSYLTHTCSMQVHVRQGIDWTLVGTFQPRVNSLNPNNNTIADIDLSGYDANRVRLMFTFALSQSYEYPDYIVVGKDDDFYELVVHSQSVLIEDVKGIETAISDYDRQLTISGGHHERSQTKLFDAGVAEGVDEDVYITKSSSESSESLLGGVWVAPGRGETHTVKLRYEIKNYLSRYVQDHYLPANIPSFLTLQSIRCVGLMAMTMKARTVRVTPKVYSVAGDGSESLISFGNFIYYRHLSKQFTGYGGLTTPYIDNDGFYQDPDRLGGSYRDPVDAGTSVSSQFAGAVESDSTATYTTERTYKTLDIYYRGRASADVSLNGNTAVFPSATVTGKAVSSQTGHLTLEEYDALLAGDGVDDSDLLSPGCVDPNLGLVDPTDFDFEVDQATYNNFVNGVAVRVSSIMSLDNAPCQSHTDGTSNTQAGYGVIKFGCHFEFTYKSARMDTSNDIGYVRFNNIRFYRPAVEAEVTGAIINWTALGE